MNWVNDMKVRESNMSITTTTKSVGCCCSRIFHLILYFSIPVVVQRHFITNVRWWLALFLATFCFCCVLWYDFIFFVFMSVFRNHFCFSFIHSSSFSLAATAAWFYSCFVMWVFPLLTLSQLLFVVCSFFLYLFFSFSGLFFLIFHLDIFLYFVCFCFSIFRIHTLCPVVHILCINFCCFICITHCSSGTSIRSISYTFIICYSLFVIFVFIAQLGSISRYTTNVFFF